jgi:hypothetical protein
MYEHVYEHRIYMLHTYCRMQLNVLCNLSYATTQIFSCMCRMQLDFSCKRQLQNPKFLVVNLPFPTLPHQTNVSWDCHEH